MGSQCGLLTSSIWQKGQKGFIGVRAVIFTQFNILIPRWFIVARFINKDPRERKFTAVFTPSRKSFTIGGTEYSGNSISEPGD